MTPKSSRKKSSVVGIPSSQRSAMTLSEHIRQMRAKMAKARQGFLSRRPHRSFRRTKRRDYALNIGLPGYFAFTHSIYHELRSRKWLFLAVIAFFSLLSIALTGLTSQETYSQVRELLNDSKGSTFEGTFGRVGEASLLLIAGFTGNAASVSTEQQIYLGFGLLMTWLVTVWLLRESMAGRLPRFRDGLYNSGAPVISTILIVLVMAVQLLPIGILSVIYAALLGVGIVSGGFGSMIFACLAALTATLVLYWMVPSFLALIIVTLPGMYPLAALRAAGDLAVGRRLGVLFRLLWLILSVVVAWMVVIVPLVILDGWLKNIWIWYENIPTMPVLVTIASTATFVWASAYVYILYRRLVEYGSSR